MVNLSGPSGDRDQRRLTLALSLGAAISSPIVGGVLLGYLLDGWLGTSPWLSVTGLIVGTISGFTGFWRILKRMDGGEG
jgi:ATP synthase protein I